MKIRILITDENGQLARRMADNLIQNGYDARTSYAFSECREHIEFWKPHLVVMDLVNAMSLFRFLNTKTKMAKPAVIVTSRKATPLIAAQIKKAGAMDFLEKPFSAEQLCERVQRVAQHLEPVEAKGEKVADSLAQKTQEVQLLNIFLKQAITKSNESHCLHNLMRMVSLRTGALRASVVRCTNERSGVVLASNDDAHIRGHNLELSKYPEIRLVMSDQKTRYIEDTQNCEYLTPMQRELQKTGFSSLAVFPLYSDGKFFGVMSLRLKPQLPEEALYLRQFGDICSRMVSLSLDHSGAGAMSA